MAFNGSKHVPDRGEMVKILERHGLAFGADTNAQTGFDATVYKLDLPKADEDTVDTTLMLLREVGRQPDPEPGRHRPGARRDPLRGAAARHAQLSGHQGAHRLHDGRPAAARALPDRPGRQSSSSANRDQIADFYAKYYRPDRAILIAVGDFDPDAMEAKIKARFGDWRGARPRRGQDPDLGPGAQARRRLQARGRARRADRPSQLAWATPPDLSHRHHGQAPARVDRAAGPGGAQPPPRAPCARQENPPFIAAGAFRGDELRAERDHRACRQRPARPLARGAGRRRGRGAPR